MLRKKPTKGKVFVGLSGGVDSSVSAALLKNEGYDVTGVFIKVWQPDWIECTWKEDRLDAMRVCATLNIPFITLDLEKEYKKEVVDYMIHEYKNGRTPNPDVMCNKHVKFGAFFEWALEQGADFVATGHYARVEKQHDGTFALLAGEDTNKDQSYSLWTLTQKQLSKTLFPVGAIEKPEVRKYAEKYDLITATKKDSQGLCFIGKVDMKDFLSEFITLEKGKVLNEHGEIIGEHNGAIVYTLGERHGFTVTKKTPDDVPLYVVSKDISKNTITVSPKTENGTLLSAKNKVIITGASFTRHAPKTGDKISARPRYRQTLAPCIVSNIEGHELEITFDTEQSSLSPGQSLVLYSGKECIGGGIIA